MTCFNNPSRLAAWLVFVLFCSKSAAQDVGAAWVVPPVLDVDKFELSPAIYDDRFVVEKKGFAGLCDKSGQLLLPIEYNYLQALPCGWVTGAKDRKLYLYNAKLENIGLPYSRFDAYNNGLALVYKERLCGLVNQQGEELVPVEYEQFRREGQTYIFRKADGEKRYPVPPDVVTVNKKRVEEAKARSVITGYYCVEKSKNERGLLNAKGDTIVPPIYRFGAIHQKLGLIVASFDGKTWGVINTQHKTLLPFVYERIGAWTTSGLLPVRIEKKWSLLRFPSGEQVFPPGIYDHIEVYDRNKDIFEVEQNGLKGLVNLKREVILSCAYSYISAYDHVTTELASKDNKRGFWNRTTGFRQEPVYREIKNYRDDTLIVVCTDSMQALINSRTGKVIIPFSSFQLDRTSIYYDSHKKFNFKISHTYGGHLHGLYNRKGQLVYAHDSVDIYVVPRDNSFWVCPQFVDASPNCELRTAEGKVLDVQPKLGGGLGAVGYFTTYIMMGNGISVAKKYSYVDESGQEQVFKYADHPKENLQRVTTTDKRYGFCDTDGNVVIKPVFEVAENSLDGYIRVKYKGKWGVLQNPRFDYFDQDKK